MAFKFPGDSKGARKMIFKLQKDNKKILSLMNTAAKNVKTLFGTSYYSTTGKYASKMLLSMNTQMVKNRHRIGTIKRVFPNAISKTIKMTSPVSRSEWSKKISEGLKRFYKSGKIRFKK